MSRPKLSWDESRFFSWMDGPGIELERIEHMISPFGGSKNPIKFRSLICCASLPFNKSGRSQATLDLKSILDIDLAESYVEKA